MADQEGPIPIRKVKSFFEEGKHVKLREGEDPGSDLIYFFDWLIENVDDSAVVRADQEKDLLDRIEWRWWSTDGKPSWYLFLNLFEMPPK